MSALHEAARRVVAAWASTRRTWLEDVNATVMALDAALKAQPEPAQEPVACIDALKDAFFEGFTSVATYNDTLLNSPEEAWGNYKPPRITLRQAEPQEQGPVAAAFATAFGAEQHPTDDRVVIERRGETLYLNGQEIDPGVLEIRRDGTTYRSAERVAVQPEPAQERSREWHDGLIEGHLSERQYWLAQQQPEPAQEPVAWATEIIDALQAQYDTEMIKENDSGDALIRLDDAIAAVEDAEKHYTAPPKSEPAQEPVAWMVYTEDGKSVCVTDNPADFADEQRALPLYTAPPQRKPLSEEEIAAIVRVAGKGSAIKRDGSTSQRIARAIERAHDIKE